MIQQPDSYATLKDILKAALKQFKVAWKEKDLLQARVGTDRDTFFRLAERIQSSTVSMSHGGGGLALCPKASQFWNVGVFGSVWLDTEVNRKLYRIAFAPDGKFYADPMDGEEN